MNRPRRAPRGSPVSLFPFLAVLLSTMGALILLLLAINRQAARTAIARALAPLQQRAAAQQRDLESQRDSLRQAIAGQQQQLDRLTRHEQQLTAQLARERQGLERDSAYVRGLAAEWEQLVREAAELRLAIHTARRDAERMERAKTALAEQPIAPVFVPVIEPGRRGTNRRPIYVECSAKAITLQPDGLRFAASDLDPRGDGECRLSLALRGLVEYYRARAERNEPYPLLLVRPDGIAAYYMARDALEPLGLEFGYELIEADWLLQYPAADPAASAAALAAMERPMAPVVAVPPVRRRGAAPGENPAANADDPLGARLLVGPGGYALPDGLPPGLVGQAGPRSDAPSNPETTAARTHASGRNPVSPKKPAFWPGASDPSTAARTNAMRPHGADGADEPAKTAEADRSGGSTAYSANGASLPAGPDSARYGPWRRGGQAVGDNAHTAKSAGTGPSDSARGRLAATPALPTASPNPGVPSFDTRADSIRAENSGVPEATSQAAGGQSSAACLNPKADCPNPSVSAAASDSLNSAAIGSDDGDPADTILGASLQAGTGGILVRRTIFVECTADGVRVLPGGDVIAPTALAMDPFAPNALIRQVRRHMAGWGRPAATFRWRPEIVCHVRPDGLEAYYALRFVLAGTGIPVTQRLVSDTDIDPGLAP